MSDARLLAILDFWHKLEFFIPFDLESRAQADVRRKSLWRVYNDMSPVRYDKPPEGMRVSGYTVFLGVFDKADIRNLLDGLRPIPESDAFEDEMRGDLEGRTCMASLDLCPEGRPLFQSFKVSTLPWAIGRVRSDGLGALSSAAFQAALLKLRDLLTNLAACRSDAAGDDPAGDLSTSLMPREIDALVDLLAQWSGFRPAGHHPAALLQVKFGKTPSQRKTAGATDSGLEEGDEEDSEDVRDIGILNSFYIPDLERAMASVAAGETSAALRQYLTPLSPQDRCNLFSAQGRETIVDMLAPDRMNRGRWSADPRHAMSLMQQFAINAATFRLAEDGLFSVNGPPGTGKTTLLRDIVADNITRRARVLARLACPADALLPMKNDTIRRLVPELTGFEMVVASSNNAAVENISNDLPKRASVWDGEPIEYLQPIAHKLAAQVTDDRCHALSDKDMPWGLIAAALGNSDNRYRFSSRVFNMKIPPRAKTTWSGDRTPLTFWEWRDEMKAHPDRQRRFPEAKAAFQEADRKVSDLFRDLQAFEDLRRRLHGKTEESWSATAKSRKVIAQRALETAETACRDAERAVEDVASRLRHLREEERLLDKVRPAWWQRLLHMAVARAHAGRIAQNSRMQINLLADRESKADSLGRILEPARVAAKTAHAQRCADLARVTAEWHANLRSLDRMQARFADICPPKDGEALESDQLQISGLWHRPEYAALRSDLFRKALRLHEAWLAAVCATKGGFGPNVVAVSDLLENKPVGNAARTLAVWQSLFMIVPVISSTFASFARQFGGLGAGTLGWVFIDEAGQAVPQAAVGALLRARRAVVIGDPLQIEPIFTLPRLLIADLAAQSPHTADSRWSPDRASVQTVADACNPLGAEAAGGDGETIWIGSPLRVHRRCLDPMFAIANDIAYDGKMVFGLAERLPPGQFAPFNNASCWIDLAGPVTGRQSVPVQVDFVARLIVEAFRHGGKLPDLYVISPFREVKQNLTDCLTEPALWAEAECRKPAAEPLQKWLSSHVGTVHTFQGKEEKTVIMLLGTDKDTASAARWAASRPNLLNVALTRAQMRFYMVGDQKLWGHLRYFQQAAADLPTVSPEDFLDRMRTALSGR